MKMADRADIRYAIGGPLDATQIRALEAAIIENGLQWDFGDGPIEKGDINLSEPWHEPTEVIAQGVNGGTLPDFQKFMQNNNIPYDRYVYDTYYGSYVAQYRPRCYDDKEFHVHINHYDDSRMLPWSEVQQLIELASGNCELLELELQRAAGYLVPDLEPIVAIDIPKQFGDPGIVEAQDE